MIDSQADHRNRNAMANKENKATLLVVREAQGKRSPIPLAKMKYVNNIRRGNPISLPHSSLWNKICGHFLCPSSPPLQRRTVPWIWERKHSVMDWCHVGPLPALPACSENASPCAPSHTVDIRRQAGHLCGTPVVGRCPRD